MAEFSGLLRSCREGSRRSQRGLAQMAGVNQAIISRMESGGRGPSGAEQVLALARAMELDSSQTDALLSSAGYWPRSYLELGPDDPTLRAVVAVLRDTRLADRDRERFRRIVELVAKEWSTP